MNGIIEIFILMFFIINASFKKRKRFFMPKATFRKFHIRIIVNMSFLYDIKLFIIYITFL